MGNKAILVASFGTSHPDTCKRNIEAVEADIAAAYPGWAVRRAFTSGMIMRKLMSRDGVEVDTVAGGLEKLAAEGFDTVIVQPTHLLNGIEFFGVAKTVMEFAPRFARLKLGEPLLTNTEDYRAMAAFVAGEFPAKADRAVCLMGHGSEHFADAAYAALEYHFRDMGRTDIHVGTVEGYPDLDTMLRHVRESGAKRALLTPLMLVAGDHAVNDMAGDEEDSWKSAFEAAGIEVRCVLRGLGEYPEIRRMYVDHVGAAMPSDA